MPRAFVRLVKGVVLGREPGMRFEKMEDVVLNIPSEKMPFELDVCADAELVSANSINAAANATNVRMSHLLD